MYCPYCGKKNQERARFCKYCGKKIEKNRKKGFKKKKYWLITVLIVIGLTIGFYNICLMLGRKFTQTNQTNDFIAYYQPVSVEEIVYEDAIRYVNSHILLTASRDADYQTIEQLVGHFNGEIIGYISLTQDYQINFIGGKTYAELMEIVDSLSQSKYVTFVMLETVQEFEQDAVDYKSDPWISATYPDKTGSIWSVNPDGANWWAEAIMMPKVWSLEKAFEKVNIGIIDSYFDLENEDLQDAFANDSVVGQEEINVTDRYLQVLGKGDREAANSIAHGSHCAGIIAARNNEFGICGISQNASLYGISYGGMNEHPQYYSSMFWKYAIAILLADNVRAISISIGWKDELCFAIQQQDKGIDTRTYAISSMKSFDIDMSEFFRRCLDKYDFLLIASAGNGNDKQYVKIEVSNKNPYGYRQAKQGDKKGDILQGLDASYNAWGCISDEIVKRHIVIVGSVDMDIVHTNYEEKNQYTDTIPESYLMPVTYNYRISDFTNRGERVDIYAPGGYLKEDGKKTSIRILSDFPNNKTDYMQGTSMSAPMVTGTAALIWGCNLGLKAEEVKDIMLSGSDVKYFSKAKHKILNAYQAVQKAMKIDEAAYEASENGIVLGYVYDIIVDSSGLANRKNLNADITIYSKNREMVVSKPKLDTNLEFFVVLEPGEYIVSIACNGYVDDEIELTLESNQTVFKAINLLQEFALKTEETDIYTVYYDLWYQAYQEYLDGIAYSPGLKESSLYAYAVKDINKDGLPELFLSKGFDEGSLERYCYVYENGSVRFYSVGGWHSSLYLSTAKENGFYLMVRGGGHQEVENYKLINGELINRKVKEYCGNLDQENGVGLFENVANVVAFPWLEIDDMFGIESIQSPSEER